MKKFSLFLIFILLISTGSIFQRLTAQEKTKAEQEKELKIQQEIDQEKKAMTEQNKEQEKTIQMLQEKQIELDKSLNNIKVEVEAAGTTGKDPGIFKKRPYRSRPFDEPSAFSVPGAESGYGHGTGNDSEMTTWEFSRSEKENTSSKDYTFDVEKSVNTVVMSVMGDCKAGEILINIFMPDGKSYSDIVIDELGNLNWRKSFTISETENQDKLGEWKFQIASTKATGFFKISLQTF